MISLGPRDYPAAPFGLLSEDGDSVLWVDFDLVVDVDFVRDGQGP